MIDAFLKMMEDESNDIDIKSLFKDKKEQISWEKMVNIFETIQIDNVSDGLKTISEKYKLTRQEELSILAYVKFLERLFSLARCLAAKKRPPGRPGRLRGPFVDEWRYGWPGIRWRCPNLRTREQTSTRQRSPVWCRSHVAMGSKRKA